MAQQFRTVAARIDRNEYHLESRRWRHGLVGLQRGRNFLHKRQGRRADVRTLGITEEDEAPQIRKIDAPEAEALDLLSVSSGAIVKRAIPVVIAIAAVVIWLVVR